MASSLKNIAKGGWHPEKARRNDSSGGGSRLSNIKGVQHVKGWTGLGKDDKEAEKNEVISRPLTALKDPYSFGPPPKRDPKAPLPPPPNMTPQQADEYEREQMQEEEEERTPQPYRVDTTGFRTDNLPAPPKRTSVGQATPVPGLPARGRPPALPSRTESSTSMNSGTFPTTTGPAFSASTQAAATRLAQAGVSVPGFDIGVDSSLDRRKVPLPPPRTNSSSAPSPANSSPTISPQVSKSQLGEFSSKFASMRTSHSASSSALQQPSSEPNAGTSWQQKQAALKTISSFKKDPSSVSLTDARAAASTANNFKQRHGDQVVDGYKRAEEAGLVDKAQAFNGSSAGGNAGVSNWRHAVSQKPAVQSSSAPVLDDEQRSSENAQSETTAISAKKKPPPPVPKKKASLSIEPIGLESPPPIPLASKPR